MSTDSSKSSNPAPARVPPAADSGNRSFAQVVLTTVTGILLYALPPILASVLLLVGLSLSGFSQGYIESLLANSSFGQFAYILVTEVIVLAFVLWLVKLTGESLRSIGIRRPSFGALSYVLGGVAVYYAAFIVVVLVLTALIPALDLTQEQELGFDRSGRDGLLWVFLSLVVLAPLAEEIVFRGYLYTRFRRVLSYGWSMLAVSVLFGVMHLQFGSGNPLLWVAAIDTFLLSLVLVYQREKTGNVWASVLTHMLKNFLAFYLIFIRGAA